MAEEGEHFEECPVGLSLAASAPQRIRLGGLVEVLERFPPQVYSASCEFGAARDDDNTVQCYCNLSAGTAECDVPGAAAIRDGRETLHVRLRLGDMFCTPVVHFSCESKLLGKDLSSMSDGNVVLYGAKDDSGVDEIKPDNLQKRILSQISGDRKHQTRGKTKHSLIHQCFAEAFGTMFIGIFGVGSVCGAVLTGYNNGGLWPVAVVWGFGVALAIASTASISGAHLNPAVSLAFALFRPNDFPWYKLLPYWLAQYMGGILGGAFNLLLFGRLFQHFEDVNDIVRGSPGSVVTASAFGEYFPNPGFADKIAPEVVTPAFAMFVEAWGTGILMFVILALTDPHQKLIRNKEMIPFYIGFTVAVLISLYAPLTQAGWNPARDFGKFRASIISIQLVCLFLFIGRVLKRTGNRKDTASVRF